jgi:hypothetical protein
MWHALRADCETTMINAFEIIPVNQDLLVVRDLPYVLAGWAAIAGGAFMAIFAYIRHSFGLPRLTVAILVSGGFVCMLLGAWLIGLQYQFSFLRRQSAIVIQMTWFGRTVSNEKLTYTTPPVADIVVTKKTTSQLILRFNDGKIKRLGLSTDRAGYDEVVTSINQFLGGASVLQ